MTQQSSIALPEDGACAFCAYLRGDRPYTILSRTYDTATLVTRHQRGRPHVLVVPLRHAPTLLDLSEAEAASLGKAVRAAAHAIDLAYARPGIAVWQNNGEPAGQRVSHVHFHVAGTLEGGGTQRGSVEELPLAETDRIAERLRAGSNGTASRSPGV